jgi:hypothetical protein
VHHLNVAHQVAMMYYELKVKGPKPSQDFGTEAYCYDFIKNEPLLGRLLCLKEGICGWNQQEQKYNLIFPIAALRSLFIECKEQMLAELDDAEEVLRSFLSQELIIRYKLQTTDDAKAITSHPKEALQCIKTALRQHELRVSHAKFVDSLSLEVNCIREPLWDNSLSTHTFTYPGSQQIQIGGKFGYSAMEQYLYWKDNLVAAKVQEHLNYPKRSNLVLNGELRVGIAAVKKFICLRKESVEIKDHADIL